MKAKPRLDRFTYTTFYSPGFPLICLLPHQHPTITCARLQSARVGNTPRTFPPVWLTYIIGCARLALVIRSHLFSPKEVDSLSGFSIVMVHFYYDQY